MGLCHEFGTQIREGCGHAMWAGETACACPECGTVCHGLFEGCPEVWARSSRPVAVTVKPDETFSRPVTPALESAAVRNGSSEAPPGPMIAAVRVAENVEALIEAEAAARLAARTQTKRAAALQGSARAASPAVDEADMELEREQDALRRQAAAQAEADRAAADDEASRQASAAQPREIGGGAAALGAGAGPGPGAGGSGGDGPGTSSGDARGDVLRWFENAFEGLRSDLHDLLTGMTQQQAMIAELLESRQADLRLVVVAEGLPDVVQDAVEAAVAEHGGEVVETLCAALGELRQGMKKAESASVAAVAKLRHSVEASERTTAESLDEVRRRQDEAEEREAVRARALKASLTKQIKPLADALEQAIQQSDRRMDNILTLLDGSAAKVAPPKPAPVKKAPAKKAAARKAAARKAPAKKAPTARRGAPQPIPVEPTPLLARRQPLRGLRTPEEG